MRCSVLNCTNEFTRKNKAMMFLKFPKNPAVKEQWTKFCQRDSEWKPSLNSLVCSQHFAPTDFSFCLMKNLTNTGPNRRRLKSLDGNTVKIDFQLNLTKNA